MEDGRDLYAEPYDPARPTVCFDETSKQLIAEARQTLPAGPSQVACHDYEYVRRGTRNLFMVFEPHAGYRHVEVTDRRTRQDFAHCMKGLVDNAYPEATLIRVVLDNLNTHAVTSLYETFAAAEANRIRRCLEFHFTPKHGSWLNMAEIEFSIFACQAWPGYIPDEETLKQHVHILEDERNATQATVKWRFTSPMARVKLHRLYPSISD